MTVWEVLGLEPDAEREAIRRAYAKKLRITHPEDDPEGFKLLRGAYEQALAEAEWRTTWAEDDASDEEAAGDLWRELDAPPAQPGWRSISELEQDDVPAFAELLPTREADLATLRERMTALETGLRGPWRASDAELEQLFAAVLAAEAIGEIGIREDVETWLAELIAETIPASDAILQQAITAFAWDDGPVRNYAAHLTLQRFDEWRMIAALNRPNHDYHESWRSLTGAPGNAFFWRVDAFRPSLRHGAAALLGQFGEVSPGLHHSFDAASAKRWEAFFARPRLTLGMLLQVPVLTVLWCWLAYALSGEDPPVALAAFGTLLACAAPVVSLYVLMPWRARRQASDGAVQGWVLGYGAVLILAGLLPGPWPAALALPALGLAIWAFVARDAGPPGKAEIGQVVIFGMLAVFMTLGVGDMLTPAQGFALGVAATLYLYLRLYHRREAAAAIEARLGEHREWWLLFLVVAVVALGAAIAVLRDSWAPVPSFYPVALCILALVLPVGVTAPGNGPPRGLAIALLVIAFLAAGVASMPPTPATAPGAGSGVPLADGGSVDREDGDILFDSGTADRALIAMERQQPAFAGIRTEDSALYAGLRAELEKFYAGQATRDEAGAAFGARIDAAYRAKLPDADPGTLMEVQRIRLTVLRALRDADVNACADEGTKAYDPKLLSAGLRRRQNAQIYNVIGNPSLPREAQGDATPVSGVALLARTAAALGVDRAEVAARIDGKRGAAARCDARIATLAELTQMPQPEVVAMLRRELRREDGR